MSSVPARSFSIAIFRTRLFGASDLDNVKKVQAGYIAQPLSANLKQPRRQPLRLSRPRRSTRNSQRRISSSISTSRCNSRPRAQTEAEIRAQLASIGVGPGRTLDGGNYNHTITFPAGQLPPVNAFWSLTTNDGKSQLLIKNLINRYLINAPILPGLKKNADGSLTLYIQNKSPGRYRESNWLPAPAAQSNW